MTTAQMTGVLRYLRQVVPGPDYVTDDELLGRFLDHSDAAAFEILVRRHGAMVLGVCRRVLRHQADAEDAFQATFLILVRKAATIRPKDRVGNWLHGVAHNTALKLKAMNAKRRVKEKEAVAHAQPRSEGLPWLHEALDTELTSLPERWRVPIVLCDLEGRSLKEVARELGWPQGTVASRLARGRTVLAKRLARHGLVLSATALACALSESAAMAHVSRSTVEATVQAASLLRAGKALTAADVSNTVVSLIRGGMSSMARVSSRILSMLCFLVLSIGLGLIALAQARPPQEGAAGQRAAATKGTGTARSDKDSDGDGLSDYQETHKYFSDPQNRDTDGDGKVDGDWEERREGAYTIRTVLRVMHPVNEAEISNDDYQDARVLARNDKYVELEVVHYPFNTVSAGIVSTRDWKTQQEAMADYVKPGLTTNWDENLRRQVLKDLAADGIDVDKLTDRQVVEQVSRWLLKRVKSGNYFNVFHVHFQNGKPQVYPGQEDSVGDRGDPKWTLDQQWDHELFGRQMYLNRACGTCTSTAVLMTTILKTVGIPTRMVICTPIVDASGGDNVDLVRKGITHHGVRECLLTALQPLANANASHTFCEVYVGGRWRRLNYTNLGQNILDPNLFGMVTHVHTFNDLADANLAKTWGARKPDDTFRFANSYTALAVDDRFGERARVGNPPVDPSRPMTQLFVSKAYWLDALDLPSCINVGNFKQDGSGHLFVHVDKPLGGKTQADFKNYYDAADKNFVLTAPGQPNVKVAFERGYWLDSNLDYREFYLRVPASEMPKIKRGVSYRLQSTGDPATTAWVIPPSVTVARP